MAWISWGYKVIFEDDTAAPIATEVFPPSIAQLISRNATFQTDVRGNLGDASVLADPNGTDWLKDRWQAASDMHGTAIRGKHWIRIQFQETVMLNRIVLDWETAYSDDYVIQSMSNDMLLFDSNTDPYKTTSHGQSPGVQQKLPLHVIHSISLSSQSEGIRLEIRSPFHRGWGVSLWSVQVYGVPVSS